MIQRYYYQAIDWVQWPWHRFADSSVGRGVIWFCTDGMRFLFRVTWLMLKVIGQWMLASWVVLRPVMIVMFKVMKVVFVATFVIGIGMLFLILRFVTKPKIGKVARH